MNSTEPQRMPANLSYMQSTRSDLPAALEHDRVLYLTRTARSSFDDLNSERGTVARLQTFAVQSALAIELLKEGRKHPKGPRTARAIEFLEGVTAADAAADRAWREFRAKLDAAEAALFDAAREHEAASLASSLGTNDENEAVAISRALIAAGARFNAARVTAARASEVPAVPVSGLSPEAVSVATAKTAELARVRDEYGVEFSDDGERPVLDAVVIARRQASGASVEESTIWVLVERRALGEILPKVRELGSGKRGEELERLFAIRARRHSEITRFGEENAR